MASRYSSDQWRTWFVEFERSDQTVGQFCQSIGVSPGTYYRWRQRLGVAETAGSQQVDFVSVSLPSSPVEIELPCGAVARVSVDIGSLRSVFGVLLELGAQQ